MWFPRAEFGARLARVQAALRERGLDALVGFQPETVTWVTGFYTRAYSGFQFVIIPAEGEPTLACRDVSAFYVDATCAFPKRAFWSDGDDKNAFAVKTIREALGESARVGLEMGSWVLSLARYDALKTGLPRIGFVDVGDMCAVMRLIKSPAEIAYQRQAARAAEAGMQAAVDSAKVGASECDVAAAVCAAMVKAGSDYPGPGVMSSGERARHLHGGYSDRILETGDTLQFEPTPHVRHYNARFMRTIKVGAATTEERRIADQLIAVQDRALAAVAPGVPAATADRIYRDGILATGLVSRYTNKTFYSVGLMMNPTDAEPLEATPNCTWKFQPGMTFHSYLLVAGFGFSETIAVTSQGCERLTNFPRSLIVT